MGAIRCVNTSQSGRLSPSRRTMSDEPTRDWPGGPADGQPARPGSDQAGEPADRAYAAGPVPPPGPGQTPGQPGPHPSYGSPPGQAGQPGQPPYGQPPGQQGYGQPPPGQA